MLMCLQLQNQSVSDLSVSLDDRGTIMALILLSIVMSHEVDGRVVVVADQYWDTS